MLLVLGFIVTAVVAFIIGRKFFPPRSTVSVAKLKKLLKAHDKKAKESWSWNPRYECAKLREALDGLIKDASRLNPKGAPSGDLESLIESIKKSPDIRESVGNISKHYKELQAKETANRHVHDVLLTAAIERAVKNVTSYIHLEQAPNPDFDQQELAKSTLTGLTNLDDQICQALRAIDLDDANALISNSEVLANAMVFQK